MELWPSLSALTELSPCCSFQFQLPRRLQHQWLKAQSHLALAQIQAEMPARSTKHRALSSVGHMQVLSKPLLQEAYSNALQAGSNATSEFQLNCPELQARHQTFSAKWDMLLAQLAVLNCLGLETYFLSWHVPVRKASLMQRQASAAHHLGHADTTASAL